MAIVTLPNLGPDPFTVNASVLNGKVDPLATDYNGNIQNVNIAAGAGIVYSKLSLTDGILNADINSAAGIVASKLDLSPVAQTIEMSSKAILEAKGADIASATTTTIWATDGNFMHITGTTTITGFGTATQIGEQRTIVFDGILTLTHNATTLILPTGANITTAAGDVAVVRAETTANARVINYYRKDGTALVAATAATALSGSVIQTVTTNYVTYASLGTTAMVLDDSKPTWAEGVEVAGIQTAITPNHADNTLIIDVIAHLSAATSGAEEQILAIYKDPTGTDECFGASMFTADSAVQPETFPLRYIVTAGGTSEIIFKFRTGNVDGDNTVINGKAAATAGRILGGALASTVVIREIKA